MSNYISFHNHDCLGSLLDSSLKLKDLVNWAKANNMKAVGVTNHGYLTSSIKLLDLCKKADIKPLIGIEFYVTENKVDGNGKKIRDNHHLCAIAKNSNGYHNLIKLHNLSFREERFYYDGRITLEDLEEHKEDLIITSACIGSVLGKQFTSGNLDVAENKLVTLHNMFGEDFYLELQNHNSFNKEWQKQQEDYNEWLIKMGKKYGIKCIVQQDSHYYRKEDWKAHQVLLCKNTGSKLSKPTFQFDSHEYYLKNEAEMLETFAEYPLPFIEGCFKHTSEIADKVEVFNIENEHYSMPTFGEKKEVSRKLRDLVKAGFIKRFGSLNYKKEYIDRIKYELEVIEKMNMQDYIYLLWDIYEFAKKNGIYRAVGRGSMGASLVLYCLDIVQINPMEYNLMFERFLSPDRISCCDCDSDWAPDDKARIEQYLRDKYGEDKVCGIATYVELTAKSSFKAVTSAMEVPFALANKITSLMDPNLTLEENIEGNETLQKEIKNNNLEEVINISKVLEGTFSAQSVHPCANVIFPDNFDNLCPVISVKDPSGKKDRVFVTSYDMKEVDGKLKFLKMDELGLACLQTIRETDKLITERNGIKINFHNLPLDDKRVYEALGNGESFGVFQMESQMFKSLLKSVKPKNLEDLTVITAIGRPSALQSGMTEQYKLIRNGKAEPEYIIPELEEPLKDTYGLMIFQETMMLTLKYYAGFSNSQADFARKICGKKLKDKIPELKELYLEGCKKMNRDLEQAEDLFEKIQQFASYSFSKIHGVLYSYMSYATAWYKVNYPLEYMCALLNANSDDLDKLNLYINECYRLGIRVTPPDVNDSGKDFQINESGELVFGLSAIKGLGKAVVNDIIRARNNKKFVSIEDFIERANKADKGSIQALLRVGAFNKLVKYPKRWDLLCDYINDAKNSKYYIDTENLEQAVYHVVGTKAGKKSDKYIEIQEEKRGLKSSKQDKLYREELKKKQDDLLEYYIDVVKRQFLKATAYKPAEKIQNEQELMGFNISTNPYKRWDLFKKYYTRALEGGIPYVELNDLVDDFEKFTDLKSFYTVGLLTDIKELKTKKGQKMAKLTFEYFGSKTTITVFPNDWENDLEFKVQKGNMVSITGHLVETNKQYSDDDYEIRFTSMRQLNVLINENNKCIIDLKDKNIEDVNFAVKKLAYSEKSDNLPVERVVIYKKGDKMLVLQGVLWINNPDKLLNYLR